MKNLRGLNTVNTQGKEPVTSRGKAGAQAADPGAAHSFTQELAGPPRAHLTGSPGQEEAALRQPQEQGTGGGGGGKWGWGAGSMAKTATQGARLQTNIN